ncbi:protein of unknown function [Methylocaldum szegediense]|uniref:Uncharacterized protein n=1 Tax=Methylocaldum szegediense TaxID=73780 RepID=A0ABN8X9Q0_9GAMM|nr:protein of unknown function [Methylocaldum szegediense]
MGINFVARTRSGNEARLRLDSSGLLRRLKGLDEQDGFNLNQSANRPAHGSLSLGRPNGGVRTGLRHRLPSRHRVGSGCPACQHRLPIYPRVPADSSSNNLL